MSSIRARDRPFAQNWFRRRTLHVSICLVGQKQTAMFPSTGMTFRMTEQIRLNESIISG